MSMQISRELITFSNIQSDSQDPISSLERVEQEKGQKNAIQAPQEPNGTVDCRVPSPPTTSGPEVIDVDDPVELATLKDVLLNEATLEPITRGSRSERTPLVSIAGVATIKLKVDQLRLFLTRNGNGTVRGTSKKSLVLRIIQAKVDYERMLEEGTLGGDDGTLKAVRIVINRKRYLNVLFSESIRPLLATRGRSLTKEELTLGMATDQGLHEEICASYNDEKRFNGTAFDVGFNLDAKTFMPINWKKSAKTLKDLTKEYEKFFFNWEKSGNHGSFGEIHDKKDVKSDGATKKKDDFEKFAKSNLSMLYMHQFVRQFPEILQKITGDLSVDVFREKDLLTSSKGRRKRPEMTPKSKKEDEQLERFNIDTERKNKVYRKSIEVSLETVLQGRLCEQREKKRALLNEFDDRKEGRQRFKNFKTRKQIIDRGDTLSPRKLVEEELESQESLLGDILELEEMIEGTKRRLKETQKKLDEFS